MPPLRSHKRRRVACQHFPDDQTLRLQAGAGEDDVIHLPSGLDRVDCERQEEEEDLIRSIFKGCRYGKYESFEHLLFFHFLGFPSLIIGTEVFALLRPFSLKWRPRSLTLVLKCRVQYLISSNQVWTKSVQLFLMQLIYCLRKSHSKVESGCSCWIVTTPHQISWSVENEPKRFYFLLTLWSLSKVKTTGNNAKMIEVSGAYKHGSYEKKLVCT